MTNYEKYKNEIDKVWEAKSTLAISNGEIRCCCVTKCAECEFSDYGNCTTKMAQWLVAEYKEPPIDWNEMEVDTPILVRNSIDNEWYNRYFAKYENNLVYAWNCGSTSWSAKSEVGCTYWNFAKLAEGEEE